MGRTWFFVSDLHGHAARYEALFEAMRRERPEVVLLGGDLLPPALAAFGSRKGSPLDFISDFLARELGRLAEEMGKAYPRVLVILGNDDPRAQEAAIWHVATEGLWQYIHDRHVAVGAWTVFGYAFVPPSPFLLKDWERYDVSRHVDVGCVSPEEGYRSFPINPDEIRHTSIHKDLEKLVGGFDLTRAIFLFHAPPYETRLDRAALDGQASEGVPLDLHVGSIAIRRFIANRQPWITLHGHVHESARITGAWRDRIGRTTLFSAAHDGPELALVRFDPEHPERATRELIPGR